MWCRWKLENNVWKHLRWFFARFIAQTSYILIRISDNQPWSAIDFLLYFHLGIVFNNKWKKENACSCIANAFLHYPYYWLMSEVSISIPTKNMWLCAEPFYWLVTKMYATTYSFIHSLIEASTIDIFRQLRSKLDLIVTHLTVGKKGIKSYQNDALLIIFNSTIFLVVCDSSEIIVYMRAWRWCILFHEEYITILITNSACAAPLENCNVYNLHHANVTFKIYFDVTYILPVFYQKPRKKRQSHLYHFAGNHYFYRGKIVYTLLFQFYSSRRNKSSIS